jgi:hypothetical protein
VTLLDLRAQQTPTGPADAGLVRDGKLVTRAAKSIDAICLHQTAVTFGVDKQQVKSACGDALLAQFLRARNVHAHVTAFDEGTFCPSYPLRAYVWHGNGANSRSIGLEIEGLYNGEPGGDRAEPTDLTIATARDACSWIVSEAAKEGVTIRYVVAHRQYSKSRRADPGWSIWQRVAIDHCERVLGLAPLPTLTDRDGRPIPKSWDPRQHAGY